MNKSQKVLLGELHLLMTNAESIALELRNSIPANQVDKVGCNPFKSEIEDILDHLGNHNYTLSLINAAIKSADSHETALAQAKAQANAAGNQ